MQTGDALKDRNVTPGMWEAGVQLPVLGIRVTPVTLAGLVIFMVGMAIVLIIEREEAPRPMKPQRDFHEDDAL